jgi:pantoate--beta-alanine ligase
MIVARTARTLQKALKTLKGRDGTVGFVPTMGFLHDGHVSLARIARREHPVLVSSIFVNPLQFAKGEDLNRYPQAFARDKKLLERERCDLLFAPSVSYVYPEGYQTRISVRELSSLLCGRFRPGHFDGVCTVVAWLLQAVHPDVLYLGQKDYQQAQVLKRMIRDLGFPVRVRVCPTVREPDGLAMSSRNVYLKPEERMQAGLLYRSLVRGKELVLNGERDSSKIRRAMRSVLSRGSLVKVQYIAVADPVTLESVPRVERRVLLAIAAFVGSARLIDNMVVKR